MGLQIRAVIAGASRRDDVNRSTFGTGRSVESTYPDVTVEVVDDSSEQWTTAAIVDAVNAVSAHAAAAFATVGDVAQEVVS